jgi:hypothetical protein
MTIDDLFDIVVKLKAIDIDENIIDRENEIEVDALTSNPTKLLDISVMLNDRTLVIRVGS